MAGVTGHPKDARPARTADSKRRPESQAALLDRKMAARIVGARGAEQAVGDFDGVVGLGDLAVDGDGREFGAGAEAPPNVDREQDSLGLRRRRS